MGIFSRYPYTDFNNLNLDWILQRMREVEAELQRYLDNAVITFADPITWDITEQYTALTVVVDSDGTAYLSKQPVPAGVDVSNTNYWLPIFNYDDNINTLRSQIAYNAQNSATTGQALSTGDLVFWRGYIYKVLVDMPAGTAFIVGSNIEAFTVDAKINAVYDEVAGEVSALQTEIDNIMNQITYDAGDSTYTGQDLAAGGLVFWNGVLYRTLVDMPTGTAFIDGTNITPCTVDEKMNIIANQLPQGLYKRYATMDEMVADFTAADIMCFVQNAGAVMNPDAYPDMVHNSEGAYFYYSLSPVAFEQQVADGGYAVLITNPAKGVKNDPEQIIVPLLECAYSYAGVTHTPAYNLDDGTTATNVRYQPNNGPFQTDPQYNNGIQCSQFVDALIFNVPYEMSRLASTNNGNLHGAGAVDVIHEDNGNPMYLSASENAHYAALMGYYRETEFLNDVEIGDICCWADNTTEEVNWRGIIHCDIVIGKMQGAVQFLDAGQPPTYGVFQRNIVKIGYTNDAVSVVGMTVPRDRTAFNDGRYRLHGIIRYPLNLMKTIEPKESGVFGAYYGSYTAGQTNIYRNVIVPSQGKTGKYAIAKVTGYTSKKNNKSGFFPSVQVENSLINNAGYTLFNTNDTPFTGGYLIFPWVKDGASITIRNTIYIRTSATTSNDEYWLGGRFDLYA